jgi:hypothetical protein
VGWKHDPLRYSAPLRAISSDQPVNSPAYTVNARVATAVDSEKFFRLLISRLT